MDGQKKVDIGGLSLPELTELLHRIADEIQLREMESAGETGATYGEKEE